MTSELFSFLKDNLEDIFNLSPSSTIGSFQDHEIEVSLNFMKISLYIDNKAVDSCRVSLWPKKDAVLVRGLIECDQKRHLVHVYGKSSLLAAPRIKICVDGEKIAGDDF